MSSFIRAALLVAGLAVSVHAQDTALTIYSSAAPGAIPPEVYRPSANPNPYGYNAYQPVQELGYAVVRQEREIAIGAGRSRVRFTDVASQIDPTTVRFESLTDPEGTRVLEQSYEFDLVSNQKLLERFIDKSVTINQLAGDSLESYTGTLLSASGGIILRLADGGLKTFNGYYSIDFPALPEGLITRPTLVWDVLSPRAGEQRARVSYQTSGITWWADYNLVFTPGEDANSGLLDVGAWVSILNQSGAGYDEAKLKLVAGDVHRAPQPQGGGQMFMRREMAADEAGVGGFEQKAFFEYHLYTLGRPATLPDNSTKQIELFEGASGVPAEKVLVYYGLQWPYQGWWPSPATDRDLGLQSGTEVDVYLRFKNEEGAGLGIPLPRGRVRVSQVDTADGSMEFIGEDAIDHTPKDETVLIKMGEAFDVVGERRQVEFAVDNARDTIDETIEIKLRNHKDQAVTVIVKESLYRWSNWKLTVQSHDSEKQDARTIHFPVTIEPGGEVVLTYSVHYWW
ncbi:MAG: DUF4139 domain-containing protein [Phycisphaerales bacterium]|nr:DUF4139 domain-containing protein [Phycisphaerales bacterium]